MSFSFVYIGIEMRTWGVVLYCRKKFGQRNYISRKVLHYGNILKIMLQYLPTKKLSIDMDD